MCVGTESQLRILFVEHDEEDYRLTHQYLKQVQNVSYKVDRERTLEAGLSALQRREHDICLVDHALEGGDGIEFVRTAIASGCRVPLIMLTGHGGLEIDSVAEISGAADYLVKGQLSPHLLERTIRHALERRDALEALQASEAQLRAVIASLAEGILIQDRSGQVLSCNVSAERILGIRSSKILSWTCLMPPLPLISTAGAPFLEEEYPSVRTIRTGEPCSDVIVGLPGPDGELRWISVNSQPLYRGRDHLPYAVVSSLFDFTRRKFVEEQLENLAYHDTLTGLPNRARFLEHLGRALVEARRSGEVLGVAFVDLDRFKIVKDNLGHAAGDQLLREAATRLVLSLRQDDVVARIGGDEFVVLLRALQLEEITTLLTRVLTVLSAPFVQEGRELILSPSIGLALYPEHGSDPVSLMRSADGALAQAKDAGENTFQVFSHSFSARP